MPISRLLYCPSSFKKGENFSFKKSACEHEYQKDGLTNQNYIIEKDNVKYAIRMSSKNSCKLGINRYAELAAMKAVSAIGAGAEIIYFSTETGNMITKYIDGRKWTNEDAATTENIGRIAGTLKKVHHLPPIPYQFSPYKDIAEEKCVWMRELIWYSPLEQLHCWTILRRQKSHAQ